MKLLDIWPCSFSKLTIEVVRSLSDEDFYLLCRRVYLRETRRSINSRKGDELVRRLMRKRMGPTMASRYPGLPPAMILAAYKKNEILDELVPDRVNKWIQPCKRTHGFDYTLTKFSFVDAPEETMIQLSHIAENECVSRDGILNFGDSRILDIGPYVVLGLMGNGMTPFVRGGKMEVPVQKVIEAVRLREFMGMQPFQGLSDQTHVWAFKLRERNRGQLTAEPAKAVGFSLVADELVETVNDWIGALPTPMTLTSEAMQHLNKIVTEILDNAERHGRPGSEVGDWHVAGFMARSNRERSDDAYDCHIAFVNTGITISESMMHIPEKSLKADLTGYVTKHRSRSGPSRETLATLYAMQDGVSSLPKGRGGLGMMEMVDMANKLGKTDDPGRQPAVTVISGRSCIRFADKYRGYQLRGGGRFQLFNEGSDVELPPDQHYVFDMQLRFPGTIVAMRFSLDCQAQMHEAGSND